MTCPRSSEDRLAKTEDGYVDSLRKLGFRNSLDLRRVVLTESRSSRSRERLDISGRQATAILGFAGVIAGSFMPWARVGIFTVNGTAGDGVITLALGGAGLLFILIGKTSGPTIIARIAAGAAAGIAIYDAHNIAHVASKTTADAALFSLQVEVGSGLYLVIAAAVVAMFASSLRGNEIGRMRTWDEEPKDSTPNPVPSRPEDPEMKTCPFCAEEILARLESVDTAAVTLTYHRRQLSSGCVRNAVEPIERQQPAPPAGLLPRNGSCELH